MHAYYIYSHPPIYRAPIYRVPLDIPCMRMFPKIGIYNQTCVNSPPIYRVPRHTVHFAFPREAR